MPGQPAGSYDFNKTSRSTERHNPSSLCCQRQAQIHCSLGLCSPLSSPQTCTSDPQHRDPGSAPEAGSLPLALPALSSSNSSRPAPCRRQLRYKLHFLFNQAIPAAAGEQNTSSTAFLAEALHSQPSFNKIKESLLRKPRNKQQAVCGCPEAGTWWVEGAPGCSTGRQHWSGCVNRHFLSDTHSDWP